MNPETLRMLERVGEVSQRIGTEAWRLLVLRAQVTSIVALVIGFVLAVVAVYSAKRLVRAVGKMATAGFDAEGMIVAECTAFAVVALFTMVPALVTLTDIDNWLGAFVPAARALGDLLGKP